MICSKHLRHTTTEKYDDNWKSGYCRFDDDNNMSHRHILSITYTEIGQLNAYGPIYWNEKGTVIFFLRFSLVFCWLKNRCFSNWCPCRSSCFVNTLHGGDIFMELVYFTVPLDWRVGIPLSLGYWMSTLCRAGLCQMLIHFSAKQTPVEDIIIMANYRAIMLALP